jgi:hypothetical protein
MSISASSFSAGYTGCHVISGTALHTNKYRGFVVNADAVVSVMTGKDGENLVTQLGLGSVSLKQGTFICVPDGNHIATIQLTSGSIVLYYA